MLSKRVVLSVFARKNVRHRNLQVSQILSENLKKIVKKITRDDLVSFRHVVSQKSIENQKKKSTLT